MNARSKKRLSGKKVVNERFVLIWSKFKNFKAEKTVPYAFMKTDL